MSRIKTFLEDEWKYKKESGILLLGQMAYHHPNRVDEIQLTGTLSYTIDERSFVPEPALSCDKYEFSLDFADHPTYSRDWITNFPWDFDPAPAEGEYVFGHEPLNYYWGVLDWIEDYASATKIGTCTRTPYTRAVDTDPWTAGTPVVTDVDLLFTFWISTIGGDVNSGGNDGTSETDIYVSIDITGTHTGNLPDFSGDIGRKPWDTWADEDYSSILTDHISDGNTADGGGHSGSTTLKLEF